MKGISQIKDVRNIKSIHAVGGSSVPRAKMSSYLELYVLNREKDSLIKELCVLDKRVSAVKRQLDSVKQRVSELRKVTQEEQNSAEPEPPQPHKAMSMKY